MTQPLAKQSVDDVIGVVVDLHRSVPPVLAVGAFLKNTLCLANDRTALVSRDVGNLETVGAVRTPSGC